MAQLTGGKLSYSQTRQIAQYEPRQVLVELAFSLSEGEKLDDFLDHVGDVAREKVHELLSLKVDAPARAAPTKLIAAPVTEKKPSARGKKKVETVVDPLEEVIDQGTDRGTSEEDFDFLTEEEPTTSPEITDEFIASECGKKNAAFKTKTGQSNAVAIKQVIKLFSPTGQVSGIPQEKRQEFLDKLAKL